MPEQCIEFFIKNKGKILGIFAGLAFSILVLIVGFLKALFIIICIFAGYYIGSRFDGTASFNRILDKIFPNRK